MASFSSVLQARDVIWVGAARVGQGMFARRDALGGWRAMIVRHYDDSPEFRARSQAVAKAHEAEPSLTTRALMAGAGQLRVHRLRDGFVDFDLMKESEGYRLFYEEAGITDRLFSVMPVNADAESFILVDHYGRTRFSAQDAEWVTEAMRGLKWFHRELLLANGLLVAGAPLSPTERRIVRLLLTGHGESRIAAEIGQSPKTTHKYITEILRKYGVKGRTGLMALWLRCGG